MTTNRLNLIATICGVVFSAISFNTIAATPVQGWYATVFGGAVSLADNVNTTPSDDGLLHNDSSYEPGYDVGGAIGYKSGPIRYEGEVTYLNAQPEEFNLAGVRQTSINGESTAWTAMANLYYDFDYHCLTAIVPFIGIGAGYAHVTAELNSTLPSVSNFSAEDNDFAVQGTAGLSWNFNNNASITVAYRYLTTTEADNDLGKRFQANMGNVGLAYRFDQPHL